MIKLIDLGLGNLESICQAFQRIGAAIEVTEEADGLRDAAGLVLPGVGAFGDGMAGLRARGLVEPIRRFALESRRPVLGICLGMQLLAESSEEHGHHRGLGVIRGRVERLAPRDDRYRVPNMGWCDVIFAGSHPPFAGFDQRESFYFAHSFHLKCESPEDIAGEIEYDGGRVTVAVQHDHLIGVQFHPEKSQDAGLQFLNTFVREVCRAPAEPVFG